MRRHRSLVGTLLLASLTVTVAAGTAQALAVGDKAPDFALPKSADRNTAPVKLTDLTAKGPVVLYTFIQAFTST